jgi:hypothetical protein
MKKKNIKFTLWSTERRWVKEWGLKLGSTETEWVKKCGMKYRRANTDSRVLMGLRSSNHRGGAVRRGGVRSVECNIEAPVGIEEIPCQGKKCRNGGQECGMQ